MAVSAKFIADFSSFHAAVDKASVQIKKFANEPKDVENALSRMADAFSGRKLIAEATLAAEAVARIEKEGGLTTAELKRVATQAAEAAEKLRAMGKDVPENIATLAKRLEPIPEKLTLADKAAAGLQSTFTKLTASFALGNLIDRGVQSLAQWTRESIEAAGKTADLAKSTGLSTDAIQEMSYVADQTGTSLETFTKAAFQLGVRLSGGGGTVKAAVDDLKLSLVDLRKLRPEDQFEAVARALEQIEEPQKRNELAMKLFGKAAQDVIPAIVEGYGKLADEAPKMSQRTIEALDRAGDAWARFKKQASTVMGTVLGEAALFTESLGRTLMSVTFGTPQLIDAAAVAAQEAAAESAKRQAEAVAAVNDELTDYVAQSKKATAETIDLTAEKRKQIEAATRLGVSVEKLADEYKVSEEAIKLVNEQIRLQHTLMGTDLVKKAEDMLSVLSRMEKQGLRPAKSAFDDIAKTMKDAIGVMESTGRASEALTAKLRETFNVMSGFTKGGLIPSKNLAVGLAQAPNVEQSLESSTMGQNAVDEFWRRQIETQIKLEYAIEDTTTAHKEAGSAAVASAEAATKGYGLLHRAVLDATTALKVMVPLGTSWVEAYKAAGLFVNDVGAFGGLRPAAHVDRTSRPLPSVIVNAPNSFFQTPAGMQQLADTVGRAVTANLNRV